MRQVIIRWCGKDFVVRRVVLNTSVAEAVEIEAAASGLGLGMVKDHVRTRPEAGDLWVGMSPASGYDGLEGECGEARTIESSIVLSRLLDARTVEPLAPTRDGTATRPLVTIGEDGSIDVSRDAGDTVRVTRVGGSVNIEMGTVSSGVGIVLGNGRRK